MSRTQHSLTLVLTLILSSMSCFFLSSPSFAGTPFSVSVSGDSKGINEFNLSVGQYYHVPEREVIVVHDRGVPDDELPVVFYVAQCARVRPDMVVDLRLRGMSWMDITLHYGLSPEIYYVPVVVKEGPPYGHAYGYYKHKKKKDWKHMRFRDEDIVNQVNLKFISEHHKYAPNQVMKYRSEGRNFAQIERDVRYEKHGRPGKQDWAEGGKGDKGKGKNKDWKEEKHQGKGNGHGHGKGNKWEDQ